MEANEAIACTPDLWLHQLEVWKWLGSGGVLW